MFADRNRNILNDSGVSLLEFALIFPLFCLFFVFLFDVTRYCTTRIVLVQAAQKGLITAQSADALGYDPAWAAEGDRERMIEQRRRIAEEITQFPRIILSWLADLEPGIEFHKFAHVAAAEDSEGTTGEPIEALILLPGESAFETAVVGGREVSTWIDHPALCSPLSPTCQLKRLSSKESVDRRHTKMLLRRDPILVEVKTRFVFSIPRLRPLTLTGRASGFSEAYPRLRKKRYEE